MSGCQRTFKVFRNHVSTFHSNDPNICQSQDEHVLTNNVCNENPCSYDSGGDDDNMQRDLRVHQESESSIISSDDIRKSSAIFLLSLKEKYKLTQVALQGE